MPEQVYLRTDFCLLKSSSCSQGQAKEMLNSMACSKGCTVRGIAQTDSEQAPQQGIIMVHNGT